MISPEFYTATNVTKKFLEGKRIHVPQKDRAIILKSYAYTLQYGENMYSLAAYLFGKENEYLWTIIADLNPLRDPTDWSAGETVLLPELIISESLALTFTIRQDAPPPTTEI